MGGAGPYAFSATNGDLLVSSDQTGVYNAYRLDVTTGQMMALTQSDDQAFTSTPGSPTMIGSFISRTVMVTS